MLTSVRLIATKGAIAKSLVPSTVSGYPAVRDTELGHPTFKIQVTIPARTSSEIAIHLSVPSASCAPHVRIQPLTDAVTSIVAVPACSK